MDRLAEVCEDIARHSGKLDKTRILAAYLKSLDDAEMQLAVQFLSEGPQARSGDNHVLFEVANDDRKLSIGYGVLRDALQRATGWDRETLSTCHTTVGDTGETAALLMTGVSANKEMQLQDAERLYARLFAATSTAQKLDILVETFRTYRPLTIKYFVKVITRGLRIGLLERTVEEAVAQACSVPGDTVRAANNRLGHLSRVALAARRGQLGHIETRLFHAMEFMLAKPLDRLEDLSTPSDWLIEDKYDGIRCQVHFDSGKVALFSRGQEDVTSAFPEIVAGFRGIAGSGIVDGELLAWREGRALNFNMLQQRRARKRVKASLQHDVPVTFIAYDLLFRDGRTLFDLPLEQRRDELARLPVQRSEAWGAATQEEVDALFIAARERGNEGLLLKRRGSTYESGRRGGAWLKLKRPFGTLDVAITAAEPGEGRRAIYLSDYTFGVRSGEQFLNVGKAYSGLSDSEVKELTRLLRGAAIDKFGRVFLVKPEVVLEVAFDGVQKSPRHKSGYALRFPRIVRWRRDKKAEECDDITRVEELYQATLR